MSSRPTRSLLVLVLLLGVSSTDLVFGMGPGDSDSVRVYDSLRSEWNTTAMPLAAHAPELLFRGVLYRQTSSGELERVPGFHAHELDASDSAWDPGAAHRDPTPRDLVLVLGDPPHHADLGALSASQRFAFQGRIFEVTSQGFRATGETLSRIARTFRRQTEEVVDLRLEREGGSRMRIEGTPEHPAYVPSRGRYVKLGELRPGDELVTDHGDVATVVSLQRRAEASEVFNFEVEHAHNYFVSGQEPGPGVLVHNICRADLIGHPKIGTEADLDELIGLYGSLEQVGRIVNAVDHRTGAALTFSGADLRAMYHDVLVPAGILLDATGGTRSISNMSAKALAQLAGRLDSARELVRIMGSEVVDGGQTMLSLFQRAHQRGNVLGTEKWLALAITERGDGLARAFGEIRETLRLSDEINASGLSHTIHVGSDIDAPFVAGGGLDRSFDILVRDASDVVLRRVEVHTPERVVEAVVLPLKNGVEHANDKAVRAAGAVGDYEGTVRARFTQTVPDGDQWPNRVYGWNRSTGTREPGRIETWNTSTGELLSAENIFVRLQDELNNWRNTPALQIHAVNVIDALDNRLVARCVLSAGNWTCSRF